MNIKNDLIIKATANNNTGTVKQSLNLLKKLSNSFDIGQICDKKGNTVLHYAAKNSNYELVKLFINKYKINMNLQNLYGQTPLTLAIGNFSTGVSDEKNLPTTEYFNRRFSRGNDLMIIDLLLKSGAKFDRAEHNYLLGIIEDQKNKNEYVFYCEKIEKTLSLISRLEVLKKQTGENAERGEKYVKYENCDYNNNLKHIYDTPEYGISGYDNSNDCISEHIYEEVDEFRVNKEAFSNNISRSVSNIDSDNAWSSWNNDESECQTLSNPQSDNEKGSRTPESGYRSGDDADQQEFKIVALPNRQPNAGKSSIAPKPANPQTKPQASPAKRMAENKISNPSFNKGHDFSSNLAADSIKEKIKMFENNTSSNPSSKVLSGSIKKALNRNNFLLKTPPLK
ncbi:MAG: ankyrin repeat domain-containing protein [Wolbachia endosymbiont of Penenirmus auritus]|nr:ankyrin repeat domain-containing protein [Wolbachia endosymbiont of Penenirmus auritus]